VCILWFLKEGENEKEKELLGKAKILYSETYSRTLGAPQRKGRGKRDYSCLSP